MKTPRFNRYYICKTLDDASKRYRLYLEYVMIACLIVLTVISAHLWSSKDTVESELDTVTTRLTQVESWRESDQGRIRYLISEREQDSQDLQTVLERIRSLGIHSEEIERRLIELEHSNMTFRTFLEENYRGSVECLLSEECR